MGDGTGFSSGSDTEGAENGQRRFAGIAQDITQRKKLEEQLRESAIRDELTGLFNRRHLNGRLEPLLEKSSRNGDLFSIALLTTRKIDRLAKRLGIDNISASQVSEINKGLDEQVQEFRTRRLENEYPVLWVDALYEKI